MTGPVTVCWLFPDRGSRRENEEDDLWVWQGYRGTAAALGCRVELASPELVDLVAGPDGRLQVHACGRRVSPEDTVFVTEFQTYPHMLGDTWNFLTVARGLELAGFYLPVPPDHSAIGNDKLLTVAALGGVLRDAAVLPSVRLTPGRDLAERDWTALVTAHVDFPAVLKPANWCGQQGIVTVGSAAELEKLLQVAAAGEMSVVLQRRIEPARLTTYRTFLVDGAVVATLRGTPGPGSVFTNPPDGGRNQWAQCPAPIAADAVRVAGRLGAPFVCIDWLLDGDDVYLSEVELDGTVNKRMLATPEGELILRGRLAAYLRGHRAFLDRGQGPADRTDGGDDRDDRRIGGRRL